MLRRNLRNERGENVLELTGMLALTAAVLGTSAYVLFFRPTSGSGFTPQQQAYIAAVQTQQADATIRAIATERAAAPPSQQSAPAAPPLAPVEPPAPPPSAPPTTIAPPPPAPPPPAKPPMATCVGYMVGLTSTGLDACQGIISGTMYGAPIRNCIYAIISGTATADPGTAACVQASLSAGDAYLSDCFLGLSGQSHFGRMSCRMYYEAH